MTLSNFLSKLLRPCGSDVAPPKSPIPECGTNARENNNDIKDTSRKDCNNIVQETSRSIDCSADLDKAHPGQVKTPITTATRDESAGVQQEGVHSSSEDKAKDVEENDDIVCEAAEDLVRVFGFDVLHQLHSKVWDDRARAVQAVRERVERADLGTSLPDEFFTAATCVVKAVLSDRVMPVYLGALELSRLLVVDFAPQYELRQEFVVQHADAMIPSIVNKTSDRNARNIEATHSVLVAMARALGCRCIVAHALRPITNAKETAAIRGRLELLELMIDEFGISKNSGVSLSAVMGWVRPQLEAADEKVRHAAVEVTVSCYSHKGERTTQYVSNLKPALLKLLESRFEEADRCGKKKGKSKFKRGNRSQRPLPALKDKRTAQMKSRASNRSTSSSSSGGRTSNSAGSSDSRNLAPLRGAGARARSNTSPDFRSPAVDRIPSSMRLDALTTVIGGDLLSPPAVHGCVQGDMTQPNYVDKFGTSVNPTNESNSTDMFDKDDEAFMKEIESLC